MIFIIAWPCCPSTTVVSTSCDDSSTSTPPAPFSSRWAAQLSSNICEHIFFITATGFYPKSRRRNRYKNSGNSKNNPSSAPQLSFWQSALANDSVSLDWVDCKMGIEDNPFRPAKKIFYFRQNFTSFFIIVHGIQIRWNLWEIFLCFKYRTFYLVFDFNSAHKYYNLK